ncbi:MAG: hypothetical protein WBM44_09300 [Waterburya sp.]
MAIFDLSVAQVILLVKAYPGWRNEIPLLGFYRYPGNKYTTLNSITKLCGAGNVDSYCLNLTVITCITINIFLLYDCFSSQKG